MGVCQLQFEIYPRFRRKFATRLSREHEPRQIIRRTTAMGAINNAITAPATNNSKTMNSTARSQAFWRARLPDAVAPFTPHHLAD
jgi:hypothetical protein